MSAFARRCLELESAFTALAHCLLWTSRSQSREDLLLIPTLLTLVGLRPGTFVELGAYNGVDFSNTFALEKCAGWHGLLIEANPTNFADLAKSDRSATHEHAAVCDEHTRSINVTVGGKVASGQLTR